MTRFKQHGTAVAIASVMAIGGYTLPINAGETTGSTIYGGPEAVVADTTLEDTHQQEARVLKGRVVSLEHFLTSEPSDKHSHNETPQEGMEYTGDGPLGVCVVEEGVINVLDGEQTYLIITDPNKDKGEDALDDARDLIGKDVKITGRVVERGSLAGIVIESVDTWTDAQAAADNTDY